MELDNKGLGRVHRAVSPREVWKSEAGEFRDGGCVDCGTNDLIQYDHVPDFELTRHTVIDELQCRCAPCHRTRHRREE